MSEKYKVRMIEIPYQILSTEEKAKLAENIRSQTNDQLEGFRLHSWKISQGPIKSESGQTLNFDRIYVIFERAKVTLEL